MRLTTFVTWSNAIGNCIAREIQLAVFLTDPELEPEVDVALERPHCLLYTDGVTEAMNRERELVGIDRLLEYLREKPASSAEALIARINPAVEQSATGGQPAGDVTLVRLRYKGPYSGHPYSWQDAEPGPNRVVEAPRRLCPSAPTDGECCRAPGVRGGSGRIP
jgi:hypothetical protein